MTPTTPKCLVPPAIEGWDPSDSEWEQVKILLAAFDIPIPDLPLDYMDLTAEFESTWINLRGDDDCMLDGTFSQRSLALVFGLNTIRLAAGRPLPSGWERQLTALGNLTCPDAQKSSTEA